MTTLFDKLRADVEPTWRKHVGHVFVDGLADGSLPEPAFRHYLVQDYLFLIQFARAYALASYKAERLEDMRAAAEIMHAILNVEMQLHVRYCADWGLTETDLAGASETLETVAYTRYVLDCGMAGDLLELHVALAPCVIGYAEIGRELATRPGALDDENMYASWVKMYAGDEYQAVAQSAIETLDRLAARRGGQDRYPGLRTMFEQATRLETAFWQMGWDAGRR